MKKISILLFLFIVFSSDSFGMLRCCKKEIKQRQYIELQEEELQDIESQKIKRRPLIKKLKNCCCQKDGTLSDGAVKCVFYSSMGAVFVFFGAVIGVSSYVTSMLNK